MQNIDYNQLFELIYFYLNLKAQELSLIFIIYTKLDQAKKGTQPGIHSTPNLILKK